MLTIPISHELRVSPSIGEALSLALNECQPFDSDELKQKWRQSLIKEVGQHIADQLYNKPIRIAILNNQEEPEVYELYPALLGYDEE